MDSLPIVWWWHQAVRGWHCCNMARRSSSWWWRWCRSRPCSASARRAYTSHKRGLWTASHPCRTPMLSDWEWKSMVSTPAKKKSKETIVFSVLTLYKDAVSDVSHCVTELATELVTLPLSKTLPCLHALIFISRKESNPTSDSESLVYMNPKHCNPMKICLRVHYICNPNKTSPVATFKTGESQVRYRNRMSYYPKLLQVFYQLNFMPCCKCYPVNGK